jgi:MFS superfamily sulfate permease-like transporter
MPEIRTITSYLDNWKWVALAFFVLGIVVLPYYPYSLNWSIYPSIFCWFLMLITLLVSVFSKRGSSLWRGKGHG